MLPLQLDVSHIQANSTEGDIGMAQAYLKPM